MTRAYWTDASILCDDVIYEASRLKLPQHRLQKLQVLKHRKDRNLCIASWLVLEEALKGFPFYNGDERILVHKNGRIIFADNPHVHFNISHSGDVAMCAVSNCPVGVDVQVERDFDEGICRRFFLPREADFVLNESDPCQKREKFFRIWTLKEAYVKMTGGGLGEFTKFELDLSHGVYCGNVFFEMFDISGCKAAVCMAKPDDIDFKKINIANCL